jgi:protein tyrosine phosphatase (PTP) superfamily phosphohydrolase (DUF442 family)
MVMTTQQIYNAIRVNDNVLTAGQPTEDQLRDAAAEGFSVVINLATIEPRYSLPDEAGLVQSLNMTYIHIPVNWQKPQLSDFDAFVEAMDQLLANSKTLIHCAANFRVSAFYSLYAQRSLGWTEDEGEAFREKIWVGSPNPIWEDLIEQIKDQIENS